MTSLLSVIIPVRDRSGMRLENCLRSLRWQELPADNVEIIISDFGSSSEHVTSIRQIAERYGAVIETTQTDEMWNRARALNIGVQRAQGQWLLCTDADMVFAPNFLPAIVETFSGNANTMVHCRCHDLPEHLPEQLWTVDDFPMLREAASLRDTLGTGACQAAPRTFFFEVRGYDEKFRYWGAEDVDMTSRAEGYGLQVNWLTEKTSMLHQWHPTMKHDKRWRFKMNRWRYRLTRHIVVKNRRRWGKLR